MFKFFTQKIICIDCGLAVEVKNLTQIPSKRKRCFECKSLFRKNQKQRQKDEKRNNRIKKDFTGNTNNTFTREQGGFSQIATKTNRLATRSAGESGG